MRKVLILCYDFSPLPSIGAQRPVSFFKHLPAFGFHPVIITRKWKKNITSLKEYFEADKGVEEIIETNLSSLIKIPEKQSFKNNLISNYGINRLVYLRKSLSLCETFLRWLLPIADDKKYLHKRAKQYLKENKVDFILVTGEPFILFKYGYLLSKQFNIPLILDYRDGWTTNHTSSNSLINVIRLKFESVFEKKYLKQAKIYCSVSDGVINEIELKYNIPKTKRFLLKNGADINILNKLNKKKDGIFKIVYTGTLYETSPVNEFLEGFERVILKSGTEKIKLLFFGIRLKPCSHIRKIEELKSKYPSTIEILDSLPSEDIAHHLVNASLLLLLLMKSQKKGIIGGKTYEYAATRNPILVVQEERTEETPFFQGRDIQTFAFTADEVVEKIENYYNKFRQGISIQTSITDEEIYSISRECQVKLLAEKLNSL